MAKSQRKGEPWRDSMLLAVHLKDVHEAAIAVLDATGEDQLAALGLPSKQHLARFRRIVHLGAALHDLGKANDHFQEMLRCLRKIQGIRHEWATHLIALQPAIRKWLRQSVSDDLELTMAQWAICGHHPAFGRPSPPKECDQGAGSQVTLLMSHVDFKQCLQTIQELLELESPPEMAEQTISLAGTETAFLTINKELQHSRRIWNDLNSDEMRLVSAAKACLIAADIAGSALPRAGKQSVWIRDAFQERPSPDELRQIVKERLNGKELRAFQQSVANSANHVVFVRAGCGSGKTLAAYSWAATQCPRKRLYFCYPTTGTATEGFRDYLFNSEEATSKFGANLFHGRASVDLEIILGVNHDDDPSAIEASARLDSLEAWTTPIVSCTVDTVLGIIQNNRRGLYAWPALARSAFVFDEIHAYDEELFGALLRFLDAMRGTHVLLMTASLSTGRIDALRKCLERQERNLTEINGPADLEGLKRYQRAFAADPLSPLPEICKEIERGGKVLWVCNTVDRAIDAANQTSELQPLIYHSRFRYEDRVERHAEVIERFRGKDPVLAICTQVAEMSLDLSATLLVTDLAPISSLIQRLGRLNRRAIPSEPSPRVMHFIVVQPIDRDGTPMNLPYSEAEMKLAEKWLQAIGNSELSQANLSEEWLRIDPGGEAVPCDSQWLDGGPSTTVCELRKTSPGITVVLAEDAAAVDRGTKNVMRVALPMPPPKRRDWKDWSDCKGLPIAPPDSIVYDSKRGAQWRK